MIGAVLGNYRVTAELSSGGMGSVYLAQHELLGRKAAIKLLRPELAASSDLVQRFFNEAKAASAIHHPGIIEVFDFGHTPDNRAYLIMEFLEGETLARRLHERGGRLAEHEAVQIARGIASALTAAHSKGIIHRDLKPENVFLVPDPDMPSGERPKLLDFGIAKLADALSSNTQTGALIGTPLYMAPEQARAAQAIDHRADLYSLGCILYQMLVGQPPFVAAGSGEIIALHLFTPPEKPSSRVPVSPELEAIVMKLLDKEPRNRFVTAAELSDALASASGIVHGRFSAPMSTMDFARQGPMMGGVQLHLSAERPVELAPEKRSAFPVIAGLVALALVAVVLVVVTRKSDDDDVPAPAPAPAAVEVGSGSAAPAPTAPPTPAPQKHVDVAPAPTPPKPAVAPPVRPVPTAAPHAAAHAPAKHVTAPAHHPSAPSGPVTSPGGGPVVHPDGTSTTGGPVTHPTTTNNSPIESDVGDTTRKKKPE